MNSKTQKFCMVPQCGNTSTKNPDKLFVFVPRKKTIRNKWLKLARLDLTGILPTSHLYFCEDHFDLPNDMENYMQYHLMGSVSQVRMKPGCLPKRYQCQPDRRKRTSDVTERSYILKKQKKALLEECEKNLGEVVAATEELERQKRFMEHREKRKFKENSKKSRKMSATTTTTTESTRMEIVEIKKEDLEPEIDQWIKTEMFPNWNPCSETSDMEIVEFKEELQDIDEAIDIQYFFDSNVNTEMKFVEIKREEPEMDQWIQVILLQV